MLVPLELELGVERSLLKLGSYSLVPQTEVEGIHVDLA